MLYRQTNNITHPLFIISYPSAQNLVYRIGDKKLGASLLIETQSMEWIGRTWRVHFWPQMKEKLSRGSNHIKTSHSNPSFRSQVEETHTKKHPSDFSTSWIQSGGGGPGWNSGGQQLVNNPQQQRHHRLQFFVFCFWRKRPTKWARCPHGMPERWRATGSVVQ